MKLRRLTFGALSLLLLTSCPSAPPGIPAELPPAPEPGEVHWLRFVQISDSQICDEESPARTLRFDWLIPYAWRPQENYGVQTLDATLQAINRRHTDERPVDFMVFTGDLADGALHNELRWFLDTMDGQFVVPDSGDPDGALRVQPPEDNPKLGFQAEGLNPAIPWYTVYGNHDELAVGVFAVERGGEDPQAWRAPLFEPVASLIGLTYVSPPQTVMTPGSDQSPAILRGSEELFDADTLQLPPSHLAYGPIVPDPDRRFLSRRRFIEEHFNTVTDPPGHGFTAANRMTGHTYYSVRPKDEVPLRLIVIDTVVNDPPPGLPVEFGVMPRDQFDGFLRPELDAAREAGEFVLIASHHPSTDFDRVYPADTVGTAEFHETLAAMPNVIVHLCGHTHRHRVTRIDGPYPYLEIETASIIDYPQEGRVFDIYYDPAHDRARLVGYIFGHAEAPTRLSAESLRRAEIDAEYNHLMKAEPPDYGILFPSIGNLGSMPDDPRACRIGSTPLSPEECAGTPADREIDHVTTPRTVPRN